MASTLSATELRRGVRLGVEGRDIIRDRDRWDGTVTVTLTVTDRGKETARERRLRVAPLMLQHDLQRAATMEAGAPGDGPGSPIGLHPPYDWDRFSSDLDRAAARTGTQTRYLPGTGTWWHDVWWQDLFEPAYASLPTPHGVQITRFAIRSGNIWDVTAGDGTEVRTPRPAARLLYRDLRSPDVAEVQELSDDGRNALVDLRNATGNIESLPPYPGYPQGRLVYGTALEGSTDAEFQPSVDELLADPEFLAGNEKAAGYISTIRSRSCCGRPDRGPMNWSGRQCCSRRIHGSGSPSHSARASPTGFRLIPARSPRRTRMVRSSTAATSSATRPRRRCAATGCVSTAWRT